MPKVGGRGFAGLNTDPNSNQLAGEELKTADNCVIRRPGLLEPRPGFKEAAPGVTMPAGRYIRSMRSFDGEMFGWSYTGGGGGNWKLHRISDATEVTGTSAPCTPTKIQTSTVEEQGNLYIATVDGVMKLSSGTDTSIVEAATPHALDGLVSTTVTTPTWLANGDSAAYKAVFYRTETNVDRKVWGSTSGRMYVVNSGATSSTVTRIGMPTNATTGDSLQLYRTKTVTGSPAGEYFLATETTLLAADIAAGFKNISDFTADDGLGAALYTNATQEGALKDNAEPPICKTMASFKGSVFYGNTQTRHSIVLGMSDIGASNGFGSYMDTCVTTTNSTTITNATTAMAKLAVGQYVWDPASDSNPTTANSYFAANTRVTGFDDAANKIFISPAAIDATGGPGDAVSFSDYFSINGTTANTYWASSGSSFADRVVSVAGVNAELDATTLVAAINQTAESDGDFIAHNYTDPSSGGVTILVEQNDIGDETTDDFTIVGSHGDSYTPNITTSTSTTSAVARSEHIKGRLHWSKTQIPEAAPLLDYVDVGNPQKNITRLVSTEDALFIFKEDGTYRLTGESALGGWRVDAFAPDLRLLIPECACTLDDIVYAFTNRGIVKITPSGVQKISGPIENELRSAMTNFDPHPVWTGASLGAGFAVALDRTQEVVFSIPIGPDQTTGTIFVFNSRNSAWTKWSNSSRCAEVNGSTSKLWMESANVDADYGIAEERGTGEYQNSDRSYTTTIVSVTGVDFVINAGSGWTPAVGDGVYALIGETEYNEHVVSVVNTTSFSVSTTIPMSADDTFTSYEAITVTVEPISANTDSTGTMHVSEGAWFFDQLQTCNSLTLGYTTDIATTAGSEAVSTTSNTDADIPEKLRYFVPNTHMVCTEFTPKLVITQANARWRLSSWSITVRPWGNVEP